MDHHGGATKETETEPEAKAEAAVKPVLSARDGMWRAFGLLFTLIRGLEVSARDRSSTSVCAVAERCSSLLKRTAAHVT